MYKKYAFLIAMMLFFCFSAEEPWGKDAEFAQKTPPPISCDAQSPGVSISRALIRFHQEVISPADGPRSHYLPSSSQYTLDAIECYGFFKGWILGCDRLMRENDDPWLYRKAVTEDRRLLKWNPIP